MYDRIIERQVREALLDTPVVLIVGPRRAGKTTLVQKIGAGDRIYLTLDDQTTLDAARGDPVGFIRGLDCATIDEIQRVPELLLAIKKSTDDDSRPGRFLLTGSANVLLMPKVADSLAGRMETLCMLPLAHVEVVGRTSTFLHNIFNRKLVQRLGGKPGIQDTLVLGDDLIQLVLVGGFPEAMKRDSERRRQDWIRSYLTSVLTRDLREIAEVEKLTELPKFVRLLAQYSGQLINYSELGSSIGINYKTSQRYIGLLEQVFLISTLSPWYTNAIKRITKAPKLHFLDSGILSVSRSLTFNRVKNNRSEFGSVLESFVFAEILKLITVSNLRLTPYHFRDQQMREVDIVLESDDGMIVGIEVKASATVTARDFAGLKTMSEACKDKFALGIVLYDSDALLPFGDKLVAVPISCLWN
jgi:predicted AAA+ superfamily ATPase